ncbi:hypothetical protein GJ496_011048 [Pomphorhynchus laevis]|nr:hypothetical protein GJ496_011048 [Pomphorhynchus laevis]
MKFIKSFLIRPFTNDAKIICRRFAHFLPESYYSYEKWDQLLTDDVMQFKLNPFMESLNKDFNSNRKVTATKMDILASKLAFAETTDELIWAEDLLKAFRRSSEYLKIPASLSHGLIRSYIDVQQTERLVDILEHKKRFGVFINDQYSANILIDSLLDTKYYLGALRVAAEIALQEEEPRNGTLLCYLSLYSILQHIKTNINYICPTTPIDTHQNQEEEDEDVEQVKVKYKPNFTYDNHFDIRDNKLLAGKALKYFVPALEQQVPHLKLLAFALMEDAEKCYEHIGILDNDDNSKALTIKLIETFIINGQTPLPKIHGISMVSYPSFQWDKKNKDISEIKETFKEKLKCADTISIDDTIAEIEQIIQLCKTELIKIVDQEEMYNSHIKQFHANVDMWMNRRRRLLKEENRIIQLKAKRDLLLEQLHKLESREEHLTFFENQNVIEMYNKDGNFADESPLLVEIHGEKEFNERYRKFHKLHRFDRKYYVVHRSEPAPRPPQFRVGAIDYEKLEYAKLKHVEPEPERIM